MVEHALIDASGNKRCSKCREYKPFSEYHLDSSNKYNRAYNCRICVQENSRLHQQKNKKQIVAAVRLKLKERKNWAVDYKGGKCKDCKKEFPNCVYDFHHLSSDMKEGNPSAFLRLSLENAKKELDKCILLCANCHRIRHFNNG